MEGVSGWLALFVFGVTIGGPILLAITFRGPLTIYSALDWALAGFGIYVGILILQRDRKALVLVKLFLVLKLLVIVLLGILQLGLSGEIEPVVSRSATMVVIWLLYFNYSKRVQLTLRALPV